LETGEEPDCIALWELTHKKNGTWPNKEAQDVYVSQMNSSYSLVLYCCASSSSDGIVLVVCRTKHVKLFKTKKLKLKLRLQVNKEALFSRLRTKKLSNASHRSLVAMGTWRNHLVVLKG
jgi:hypothetical protein